MSTYDVIVLGCGGFGSSCLYHLAQRSCRVLGVDRFLAGHDRGSSHGDTRIIRQAYFEHADYVPLLRRSYELWRELEAASGRSLLKICGLMQAGPASGEVVPGVRKAADLYGIPIENFSPREAERSFPGFRFADDMEVVLEPGAGILAVEDCVRTHTQLACEHGVQLAIGSAITDWSSDGRAIRVTLANGDTHSAAALILTPGAWAPGLLKSSPSFPQIEVRRKVLLWNSVAPGAYSIDNGGVTFLFECPDGVFYGFPSVDGQTLKCGEHSKGNVVNDPLNVDRSLHAADIAPIAEFLARHMPQVSTRPERHAVCLYSMSPDGHFLVDRHPEHPNVFFGAGFSGHGFKFTSAIGEALADLAATGKTNASIAFLGINRFR